MYGQALSSCLRLGWCFLPRPSRWHKKGAWFVRLHGVSLEKTVTGESADRSVSIYLPPSYDTSPNKRYPVVYLLHGGAHSHPEDDIFYVIEGTMNILVGDRWIDAPRGSFVLAPGGVTHDFQNRSLSRAGVLNLSIPGDFEKNMPAIVEYFAENPPGDA